MRKILLAIQLWERDMPAGEALANLLIDMKRRGHYQFADVALVLRFDCPDPSPRIIRDLEMVFDKVWVYRSRRKEVGWPAGCNGVWHETMAWSYEMHRSRKMDYSAILTTEADACPLALDWDEQLARVRFENPAALVIGFWHNSGLECGHINGNALFDPMLVSKNTQFTGCPAQVAWDTFHAPLFKQLGWVVCKEIHSMWSTNSISMSKVDALRDAGVIWFHGVKDNSVHEWARLVLC